MSTTDCPVVVSLLDGTAVSKELYDATMAKIRLLKVDQPSAFESLVVCCHYRFGTDKPNGNARRSLVKCGLADAVTGTIPWEVQRIVMNTTTCLVQAKFKTAFE